MTRERIYGLIGRKLGHSRSPLIHRELGCPDYKLYELEPDEVEAFVKSGDIGGLNVTIPYKKTLLPLCARLSPEARAIGSVNTIAPDADGRLTGYNTDAGGFIYMAQRAGISLRGKKTVIFGSGGAQLAAGYAAKKLGASEIIVISRSGADNYENLPRHYDAEILINTTPVGMYPNADGRITDVSRFKSCRGVLDLVYNPYRTDLILQAQELGIPCAGGLSMLVAQACRAEEHFTGRAVDAPETERILRLVASDMRNIVLIGMPGSGKSTIGALLARLSGRELIDTDGETVKLAGKSIPEIFASDGEARFRALEREAVSRAASPGGRIIVTGGGAVTSEENYRPLRRTGRVYHLERGVSLLARGGRPLSQNADLSAMYEKRLPLYVRFRDAAADNNGAPAETAERIWRDFCENSCD